MVVALNTGLRQKELFHLRWGEVDLIRRRLIGRESKTKAGEGRRILLNERAFAALTMQAARFPDRKPEDHVFPMERFRMLPDGLGSEVYDFDPEKPRNVLGRVQDREKESRGRLPMARLPAYLNFPAP